eukprot:1331949-Amphidinium_carterae.1
MLLASSARASSASTTNNQTCCEVESVVYMLFTLAVFHRNDGSSGKQRMPLWHTTLISQTHNQADVVSPTPVVCLAKHLLRAVSLCHQFFGGNSLKLKLRSKVLNLVQLRMMEYHWGHWKPKCAPGFSTGVLSLAPDPCGSCSRLAILSSGMQHPGDQTHLGRVQFHPIGAEPT